MIDEGTVVRHKKEGWLGYVGGVTKIKACFTGETTATDDYQIRIFLKQKSEKPVICPEQDLEILPKISPNDGRWTHCYICKSPLGPGTPKCKKCNDWYICWWCEACGCGYSEYLKWG